MSVEVHEDTELYTIEYDDEIGAIMFTWDQFASGTKFREGCEALLDAVRQYDASKVLTDTRGIRAHDAEDQVWMQEDWIPRAQQAGVEYTATVHPDSVIAEMDIEKLVEGIDDSGHEPLFTADMDEARRWLAEQ
jgi:hypothetical protein